MIRLRKHVQRLNPFHIIPQGTQPGQVSGQGGRLAGDIQDLPWSEAGQGFEDAMGPDTRRVQNDQVHGCGLFLDPFDSFLRWAGQKSAI